MSSRPCSPFSPCSRGTVTSCSTSEVDRPTHAVWMTTRGGANSGNTSTRIWDSEVKPSTISTTDAATTMKRRFRLDCTIQRMTPRRPVIARR